MKNLKKIALATAVATMATSSFALEQLDDATMANTTGQDGITITISPDAENGVKVAEMYIHDNDGLAADSKFNFNNEDVALGGTGKAGAVLVKGLQIKGGDIAVDVDTDAGKDGSDPFVNASVNMSGETTISLAGVDVVASGQEKAKYNGTTDGTRKGTAAKKILGGLSLSLQDAKMNVQMGAQPQGAMVLMDANLTGGLNIKDLEIIDADGHAGSGTDRKGGLLIKDVVLTDTDSANMTLAQKIDIDSEKGLVIEMKSPTGGFYGYMTDVGFSDGSGTGVFGKSGANVLGDVEIVGLDMGTSTISISGH